MSLRLRLILGHQAHVSSPHSPGYPVASVLLGVKVDRAACLSEGGSWSGLAPDVVVGAVFPAGLPGPHPGDRVGSPGQHGQPGHPQICKRLRPVEYGSQGPGTLEKVEDGLVRQIPESQSSQDPIGHLEINGVFPKQQWVGVHAGCAQA